MKKVTFVLVVVAALAVTACGSGTPTTETTVPTDSTATQVDSTSAVDSVAVKADSTVTK